MTARMPPPLTWHISCIIIDCFSPINGYSWCSDTAPPCPTPSLLELQKERRETTKLGYPGRCRWQPPETHEPCLTCAQPTRAQPLPFSSYRKKGERRPSSGTRADVDDSPQKHMGLVPVHSWQRAWFMAQDPGLRGETELHHRPGLIIVFGPSSSGGHFFKPWRFWNLLGISIWDLGFKTSTDGHTGSGFQDLDKRTYGIWVLKPRQTDIRDLDFRTLTNGHTGSGFQDLDREIDAQTYWINI
jgi:hypothetical protein